MISVDCIMNALEHCKVRLPFFLIHPVQDVFSPDEPVHFPQVFSHLLEYQPHHDFLHRELLSAHKELKTQHNVVYDAM